MDRVVVEDGQDKEVGVQVLAEAEGLVHRLIQDSHEFITIQISDRSLPSLLIPVIKESNIKQNQIESVNDNDQDNEQLTHVQKAPGPILVPPFWHTLPMHHAIEQGAYLNIVSFQQESLWYNLDYQFVILRLIIHEYNEVHGFKQRGLVCKRCRVATNHAAETSTYRSKLIHSTSNLRASPEQLSFNRSF
ncbi:Uncharacterized protein Fot_32961 [Forsythia ovata]|uniref:Uncharacterized protein n=1 Tax=Forsythia ovata TaxID=205694 RepID=A0ABD1T9A5_9LAMI